MSSWERARYVPWDRIPLPDTRPRGPGEAPPVDLDARKERIFRQLQKESKQQEQNEQPSAASSPTTMTTEGAGTTGTISSNQQQQQQQISNKELYSHMELLRQLAFGGCIGSITGAVFGFMDGMRTAGESPVLQKASNMAKFKFLMQGTSRSAFIFGSFFGGFHIIKYGLRIGLEEPGEYNEIVMAAPVSLGILAYQPTTRQAMPYATMLVFMDAVNIYMRKTD